VHFQIPLPELIKQLNLNMPLWSFNVRYKTNSGMVCNPNNIPKIKETVMTLYKKFKKGEEFSRKEIYEYNRLDLAEKLAKIINTLETVKK